MPALRTADDLLSILRNFLATVAPDIDASVNSLLEDLLLKPYSVAGELLTVEIEKAFNLLATESITGSDLDREASNYGLVRSVGSFATGTAIFYTTISPTVDIVVNKDTRVATQIEDLSSTFEFATTEKKTLFASTAATFFNPENQRWELPVPISAVVRGVDGNVASGKISRLVGTISGMEGVTNYIATSGGLDQETDVQLRKRILTRRRGRSIYTRGGLASFLLSQFPFDDVQVVDPSDPDSERINGADAWAVTTASSEAIDSLTYTVGVLDYAFTSLPVLSITEVLSGTKGVLSEGVDYSFLQDTSTAFRFSTESNDLLRILPAAGLPNGDPLTVTYNYSSDVVASQALLDEPQNDSLSVNPLVKKAIRVGITIDTKVSLFTGTNAATAKDTITSALSAFFDQLEIGAPVERSDVIVVLQTGFGDFKITSVDQVVINSIFGFDDLNQQFSEQDQKITLDRKHYPRLDTIIFR